MRRWRRPIHLLLMLTAVVCVAALVWLRRGDADAYALAKIRLERLTAWRLDQKMPGAVEATLPLEGRLAQAGFKLGAPAFVRIYKRTYELEVWLKRGDAYAKFATYPICYFSGNLGPKLRTGDWQSPEGIYQIEARQLNPNSRWHRAFNLGFPNAYDRAHGRTGSYLMVHGGCSSIGCYAITNAGVDDVYRIVGAAIAGGQARVQVQALPFRLTKAALELRQSNKNAEFWTELKAISDAFEARQVPPDVAVCDGHYVLASPGGRPLERTCARL